ncbi:MAG: hypothetical protein WD176_07745, partial [Pirellulales bacterium]
MVRTIRCCAIVAVWGIAYDASAAEPSGEQAEIGRLIAQLGDDVPFVRERAQSQLAKMGFAAFDALSAAENHADPEISARAKFLVRSIRVHWTRDDDPPEMRKLFKDYDQKSATDRKTIIQEISVFPSDSGTDPLCRVTRYEKSTVLSKLAALGIIDRPPPEGDVLARQITTIRGAMGSSARPAAQWLLAYVAYHADPAAALTRWEELVAAETTLLSQAPNETSRDIVLSLRKRQYVLLVEQKRADDGAAVLKKAVEIVPADKENIVKFLDWLVKQKAWSTIDEVTVRFARQFERNPLLLYSLAEARLAQGKPDLAEDAAAKAVRVAPEDLALHRTAAMELQELGLFRWAEREYRHVIGKGSTESPYSLDCSIRLSDMLHDQLRDLDAAKSQQMVVDAMDKNPRVATAVQELRTLGSMNVRARLEFYYACHFQSAGDIVRQAEHLDKAIRHDPTDADILIALYRLPNVTPERRTKTVALIRAAARKFEEQIAAADESEALRSIGYNQYAWLIANTEGDFDRALRYSQLSVESYPNAAGYLDTLARCYYAKGDTASAIRHQTQANR